MTVNIHQSAVMCLTYSIVIEAIMVMNHTAVVRLQLPAYIKILTKTKPTHWPTNTQSSYVVYDQWNVSHISALFGYV